jgi:AcrR family transcriptional regulator
MSTAVKKSDATRAKILEAALELFREQGFEKTTMRQVAAAAGVATGAAYYYFESKDATVLAFYDQARQDMAPRLGAVLEGKKDLAGRLRGLIEVKLAYFAPSRRLLGALSGYTSPSAPLSPFSERTREIREHDIGLFARALEGSRVRVAEDLKPYLPLLLWMYQMGVILFWINDDSNGQRKTRALLDKSLDVVVGLVKLAGLPLTRPLRKVVIELVDTVVEGA